MIHHIEPSQLKGITMSDGLILQGCGGDPTEWIKGINEMLTNEGILKNGGEFKDVYVFDYGGTTNILYPFDKLDSETLDMGKLAMWRLQTHSNFAGTWHSDYLDHNPYLALMTNSNAEHEPDIINDKDYYIGYGPDHNGVAVWNWHETTHEDGSEKFIAHINHNREITYLEENIPENVIAEIKVIAQEDWKELFATEMAGLNYNPKPPPSLYLEQIAKWLENETGTKQQIIHTGENSGIRYIDHDSQGQNDAANMTIIADADIDIRTISWSAEYGIGINTDKTDNTNGEKVHVILWSADEVSKDERGCFVNAVGALNGVLVIKNPDVEITKAILDEMMSIEKNNMDIEGHSSQTEKSTPFTVHLENVHNLNSKYFELPLPATAEDLQPLLADAGIFDWRDVNIYDITSDVDGLGKMLHTTISDKGMSSSILSELNYLASKLQEIFARGDFGGQEIFLANLETGRNSKTIADMINLTFSENLNKFDVHPVYNARDYGEFQVDMVLGDEHAEVFNQLKESENPEERAFIAYIEKLESHVDKAALGRTIAKEEGGVFTKQGYFLGDDNDVTRLYHGAQDIPAEFCLLPQSNVPTLATEYVMKIDDVNIAETIVKLHAVYCRNMEYSSANVKSLFDAHKTFAENTDYDHLANHYILILNRSDISIAPAMDVYKSGSEISKFALDMTATASKGNRPDIKAFAVRVNNAHFDGDVSDGKDLRGDFIELSPQSLNAHISRNAVIPERVDVLSEGSTQKSYNLFEWGQMLGQQNGNVNGTLTYHYPANDIRDTSFSLSGFIGNHETRSQADSFEDHLPKLCNPYNVAQADVSSPQPAMIAVANEAAKEILARGDAGVFRLSGGDEANGGVVKLAAFEALRPLCFAEYRDTAIKLEDAGGLNKWAERKVSDISRKIEKQAQREARKKSHGEEL